MTARTIRGTACGVGAVAVIAIIAIYFSSNSVPKTLPPAALQTAALPPSAKSTTDRAAILPEPAREAPAIREPGTPQGAPFSEESLATPLTDAEKALLDEANGRVEALHREVERSNAKVARAHTDAVLSVVAVIVTPPTHKQLQRLSDASKEELQKFGANRRLESAANKSFHAISNSYTDFQNTKYKVLVPMIREDPSKPPEFVRGFSNNDEIARKLQEGADATATDGTSTFHMEIPTEHAEFTPNWRGSNPLYLRYSYLFEIEESE